MPVFCRRIRWRAIAAGSAAKRRDGGRSGKAGTVTGNRQTAVKSGRSKASVTGNGSGSGREFPQRRSPAWVIIIPIIKKYFFGDSCDRPGCYLSFERRRRSPLQRFCCRQCRRALERVLERERRWRTREAAGWSGDEAGCRPGRQCAAMRL